MQVSSPPPRSFVHRLSPVGQTETDEELARIARADGEGSGLDPKAAIDYYKLVFGQAELADRFLFDITKSNLLAFAAIVGLSSTSLVFASFDRTQLLRFCLGAVIVISAAASALVFFYERYAGYLYGRAWVLEKAWLRGRTGHGIAERLRVYNAVWGRAREAPGDVRRQALRFFPLVNAVPALACAALLALLETGWLAHAVR